MKKLWNLITGAYDALVTLLSRVRLDRLYHFMAGLIIGSFFAITLRMPVCIVPVFFAAFIKEMLDGLRDGNSFDWLDLLATVMGGLVIQLFVIM